MSRMRLSKREEISRWSDLNVQETEFWKADFMECNLCVWFYTNVRVLRS